MANETGDWRRGYDAGYQDGMKEGLKAAMGIKRGVADIKAGRVTPWSIARKKLGL